MKTLSLYIDRWYIAAAVSCDNIPRRIELPNREYRKQKSVNKAGKVISNIT